MDRDHKRFCAPLGAAPARRHSIVAYPGLATPPESPGGAEPQQSLVPYGCEGISCRKESGRCSTEVMETGLESIAEEVCSVVEHVAEQTMADAAAPLQYNLRQMETSIQNLQAEGEDMKELNDTYNRQVDLHYRVLQKQDESQSAFFRAQNILAETQTKVMAAQAEHAQRMAEAQSNSLMLATDLTGHLSKVVLKIPEAVEKAIYNAVRQQSRDAAPDAMDTQDQHSATPHEPLWEQWQPRDSDCPCCGLRHWRREQERMSLAQPPSYGSNNVNFQGHSKEKGLGKRVKKLIRWA